jgi:DNA-binding MarR family transcriptional regulator
MADRVAALTIAGATRLDAHVNEASDAEASRLRRLNEEVARIAETLARLTRGEVAPAERPPPGVADRPLGYGAPPPRPDTVAAHDIRQTIRARRLRQQFFDKGLFEDPAWDMLLDLFAAELERAQVSVSSLCIAAAVAPTTALRWIAKMTEAGLFVRHPDPFDRRRAFMALSDKARIGMQAYCAAARRAGLPIA